MRGRSTRILKVMFECPVCGSMELTTKPYATWPPTEDLLLVPPYEDTLGAPSYEVCPNCGFEFGNDDNPGTGQPASLEDYRAQWADEGSPRFEP
jgi:RNA polymerase subunit RPABC4/transcription elongation factor Spt4